LERTFMKERNTGLMKGCGKTLPWASDGLGVLYFGVERKKGKGEELKGLLIGKWEEFP